MAKKIKFKPTPAGILFLSAIAVLLIAIIVLIVFGIKNCGSCKKSDDRSGPIGAESALPGDSSKPIESIAPSTTPGGIESPDPDSSTDPNASIDPSGSTDPDVTPGALDTAGPSAIINTSPGAATSASPDASASPTASKYYTTPTSAMKKNAQKGYVNATDVNMRATPNAKNGKIVKSKIAKYTPVTLYVEQEGWWFLKCGDKYGYIKANYISKGSAPTAKPTSSAIGKVIASKIALRKSPDENALCIKEYKSGEQVTISWYEKDSKGQKWYYVKTSDGKNGYMYADFVKITNNVKVNPKS